MKLISLILLIFILGHLAGMAESGSNEYKDTTVIKSIEGLNFKVPEDMPIKKQHGIFMPMGTNEYVAAKFSKVYEKIEELEESIKKIKDEIMQIKTALQSQSTSLQ